MTTPDDHTRELLGYYQRNLGILHRQEAAHGGRLFAPLHIINQILDTEQTIERLQHGSPGATSQSTGDTHTAPAVQVIAESEPALSALVRQVRLRGVRVVQPTDQQRAHAFSRATAALLYVDGKSIRQASFARRLEPFLMYLRSHPQALLFVLARSISAKQRGTVFDPALHNRVIWLDGDTAPALLATTILEATVQPILQTLLPDKKIDIDLFSYTQAEYRYPGLLCIDAQGLGKQPADWDDIWQALVDVRRMLETCHHKKLAVRPMNSRLSLAIAFGAVFATSTRFHLDVAYEQRAQAADGLDTIEWWLTHAPGEQYTPLLKASPTDEPPDTCDAWSIWLNISRRVNVAAQGYFDTNALTPVPIISVETPTIGLTSVQTGDEGRHAAALAQQFGQLLRDARDQRPGRLLHWFYALPVSLAVLMGQQVNACGPIQCYEFLNDESRYVPACLIRSTQDSYAVR